MTTKRKMESLDDSDEINTSVEDQNTILPPDDDIPDLPPTAPKVAESVAPTKVPDYRSQRARGKDKLMASIGISRKYLPPITRKRTAIYELVNMHGRRDARLQGADAMVDPYPYELVPNYVFTDTEEQDLSRREKTLTYYEGGTETVYVPDPVTKKNIPTAIPRVGAPAFINGQVVVNIMKEYQRFVWWELHPRNATNKWRNYAATPIFKRVDIEYKSPHVQNIREDLKHDAVTYLRKLKSKDLINLAAAMKNPTINPNLDPQTILLVLRQRAMENPEEVLFTAHDEIASVKVQVIHALDHGILTYIPEYDAYFFAEEEKPMYRVPTGNNPFDSVCKWLQSKDGEAQQYYSEITGMLGFWYDTDPAVK